MPPPHPTLHGYQQIIARDARRCWVPCVTALVHVQTRAASPNLFRSPRDSVPGERPASQTWCTHLWRTSSRSPESTDRVPRAGRPHDRPHRRPGLSASQMSNPQAELLACTQLYLTETLRARSVSGPVRDVQRFPRPLASMGAQRALPNSCAKSAARPSTSCSSARI